jgi:hypothetical protein
MYATIRTYADAPELAEQLKARGDEVDELISSVPGFRGYFIVKTDGGCATISLFDDASGAEESTRRAKQWLADHANEISAPPMTIWQGDVLMQVGALARA